MFRKKKKENKEPATPQKAPVNKCGGFLPQTVFIVGTSNPDGKPNLSVTTSVSYAYGPPESLVVSLFGHSRTRENINRTGAFTANICTVSMGRLADYMGSVSGTYQKKDAVPFEYEKAQRINAPVLKESPYTMECRVTHAHRVGETVILVSEIVSHLVDVRLGRPYDDSDEAWFNWLNESDIRKMDPLLYTWKYYKLGDKLGKLGELAEDLLGEDSLGNKYG
jgi:flavin reductase (DIM6/NTAB) family NADH-FMN oxidoreductase RutF